MSPKWPQIAVIGAGMAGLAAAHRLVTSLPEAQVVIFDAQDRVGGKLRAAQVAGQLVDVGAESLLARSELARTLIEFAGMQDRVVYPESVPAHIYSRGRLHPIPTRTLMGIPVDPTTAAGLLTPDEVTRAQQASSHQLPPADGAPDTSLAAAIGQVYGAAVVDRLVEPLMGGIYAGRPAELSLAATMPALNAAYRAGESIPQAVARFVPPASAGVRPPMVMSLAGGLTQLPLQLAAALMARGAQVHLQRPVHQLGRTPSGWQLQLDGELVEADAVVLAVPAPTAARLCQGLDAQLGEHLDEIVGASMAIATFAFAASQTPALPGSGFLVAAVEGWRIKAATFSSNKWQWLAQAAPQTVFVRTSIGRAGDSRIDELSDSATMQIAHSELSEAIGSTLPAPLDSHIQRWSGGIPQYTVGHRERVNGIHQRLVERPTLALAGAAYDGVGIAAVIAGGVQGADRVLDGLATRLPGQV